MKGSDRGQVHGYYVYILANRSRTLYTGVSGDIVRRVWEHKNGEGDGFTTRYRIDRLVYLEEFADVNQAIAREKVIKGWIRARKIELIESVNPTWDDLSKGWYEADS